MATRTAPKGLGTGAISDRGAHHVGVARRGAQHAFRWLFVPQPLRTTRHQVACIDVLRRSGL